jgi:hypothetical protein
MWATLMPGRGFGDYYQHCVTKCHDVARVQLAAAAILTLPVDQDVLFGQEVVELASGVDDVRQLEQLPEPDHLAPDRDLPAFHGA